MAKPAMSADVLRRYLNLLVMAERGTTHEKTNATEKIARIKKRYDVDAKPSTEAEPKDDLFAKAASIQPDSSEMRSLVIFKMQDAAVGNLVKWVLSEAFKIKSVWRTVADSAQTELFVGAKEEDLPHLRHIAHVVNERFNSLWDHFSTTTSADPSDESSFHLGLYDGIMREPRKPGQGTPIRAQKRKRGRTQKTKKSDQSVRPHAYSVGLELGAEIRLNRSITDIRSLIDALVGIESA